MKITLDFLRQVISETLDEISHDEQSDGIESMSHEQNEEKKKKRKLRRKNKKYFP